MKYIRPPHLVASFLSDGRLLVKDSTLGIAAKVPPFTATLFSLCSTPQNRESIKRKLSEQGAILFDQLVSNGLLIRSDQPPKEQMFDNFAHISVHRTMLHDEQRLDAYKRALSAVVKPESIVIDAGSGTGALAIYAALAGAKHVYAIENSDLHAYIQQVAQDSGVADRITVINKNFADVRLETKADILVTETFGAWALAEGAAADLQLCITNNLKKDGILLPSHVDLWMAPMHELPDILLEPFRARVDGLNLSFFKRYARLRSANIPVHNHAPPVHVARLPLTENKIQGTWTLEESCKGLALWFDLHFPHNIILSTHPQKPITHWKQTVIAAQLDAGTHSFHGYPAEDDPRSYILQLHNQEYRIR
jgi:hypothetical protein